jgi:hypothetical protein
MLSSGGNLPRDAAETDIDVEVGCPESRFKCVIVITIVVGGNEICVKQLKIYCEQNLLLRHLCSPKLNARTLKITIFCL